jgi:hypothetical protein
MSIIVAHDLDDCTVKSGLDQLCYFRWVHAFLATLESGSRSLTVISFAS